jgi:hypothetical protein
MGFRREIDNMQAISLAVIMTAKTERDGHESECIKKRAFFKQVRLTSKNDSLR